MATLEETLPAPTTFLGIRHLPPINGGDGLTRLVEFAGQFDLAVDTSGVPEVWTGPTSVSFDSPSEIDPVANLALEEVMAGFYYEFDLSISPRGVQREWEL